MKKISSKLILVTLILVSTLIFFVSFFSLRMLTKETRAFTFQNQQLQTQALARTMELEIAAAQQAATRIFALRSDATTAENSMKGILFETQANNPSVKAIGVYLKDAKLWIEVPAKSISGSLNPVPNVNEVFIMPDPHPTMYTPPVAEGSSAPNEKDKPSDTHFAIFPGTNALVAVRLTLDTVKSKCSGLPVGFFTRTGEPILFCNHTANFWPKEAPEVLSKIFATPFRSGSVEISEGQRQGLWGYSNLSTWGKVLSLSEKEAAYRASYLLGIRVILLVLMSIGVALMVSIWIARKVSGPITVVSEATQKIAQGEFDTPIVVNTNDETRTLADSVLTMAQKIKELVRTETDKAKLDAQLEVAGVVQRTLIPPTSLQFGRFRVMSVYKPADQCGGDWWGYVLSKKRLAILIGDVTGHGYPSALLVATTRGYISMLQERVDQEGEINFTASETLRILNRVVFDAAQAELNMTAMTMILDLETGDYTIASAGHNAAYQLNPDTSEVKSVTSEGVRLGEVPSIEVNFPEATGSLATLTEKMILYTDGVQDLGKDDDHILGRKGFKKFLQKKMKENGPSIIKGVEGDLISLNEGRPLLDDITFIVIDQRIERKTTDKTDPRIERTNPEMSPNA